MRGEGLQEIAAAAVVAAQRRTRQNEVAIAQMTDALIELAKYRLHEIAHDPRQAFSQAGLDLKVVIVHDDSRSRDGWTQQIISAARTYRYFADLNRFCRWVQLRLDIGGIGVPTWRIVVSFHHKEVRTELMAAVVFMTTLDAGCWRSGSRASRPGESGIGPLAGPIRGVNEGAELERSVPWT